MGKLTTHVLDTTRGKPGNGISIALYQIQDEQRNLIKTVTTNHDGRVDEPILEGSAFDQGVYELMFSVGPYFDALQEEEGAGESQSMSYRFLDDVVIRFGIEAQDEHYHVPLLITQYSYSTYRGS